MTDLNKILRMERISKLQKAIKIHEEILEKLKILRDTCVPDNCRAKSQIIEDIQILEESMQWNDDPELYCAYSKLSLELKAATELEIREQTLEDIVSLESCLQSEDPTFTVNYLKIRSLVDELSSSHVFK